MRLNGPPVETQGVPKGNQKYTIQINQDKQENVQS